MARLRTSRTEQRARCAERRIVRRRSFRYGPGPIQTRSAIVPDDLFSVAGQVTLISGGSRGIGRGLAEGFVQRGATVVITGREQKTLEETARAICPTGGTVHAMVCDVADPKAIERLVRSVIDDFGRVDTLINVAGVN